MQKFFLVSLAIVVLHSVTGCSRKINQNNPSQIPEDDNRQISVQYISDIPIAGFQFKVTGVDVTGAGGGAAENAGFTVQTGNNTVLGFSFAGDTIPAGSGTLTLVELDGPEGNACLNDVVVSDSNGIALEISVANCSTINISSAGPTSVDVLYDTATPIAGFQFDVTGVDVTGASGGAAETAGFTVQTGNNTVLGFSFTGATIPESSGTLTALELEAGGNACLTDVVISDSLGNALTTEVEDCLLLIVQATLDEAALGDTSNE